MARESFKLDNKNGTVTFKYGSFVESFDIEFLGPYDTFERIRYAAITAGISLSDETLEQLLREVKNFE